MMEEPPHTIATTPLQWEAPGPGFWRHDDTHVPNVVTHYFLELAPELGSGPEIEKGFRDYGMLFVGFEPHIANGYYYRRPRMADPSAFHFLAECASQVFATKQWRQDRGRWLHELEPQFREALQALQQIDPTTLDDAALRQHLHAIRALVIKGYQTHISLLPIDMIPVGNWLRSTCEWTRVTPTEALQVLRGQVQVTLAPLTLLDRLVEAIRRSPEALSLLHEEGTNTADRLERLLVVDPSVAARLSAYLHDYGDRLISGMDFCEATLRELPNVLLGSIIAKMGEQTPSLQKDTSEESVAQLRQRVPAARQAEYDALFAEACFAFGLQEENVGLTLYWPSGLMRRALLAAGCQLVARSLIEQPEHLLDATQAEIDALLDGPGTAPDRTELARRAKVRRMLNQITPPDTLGEPDAPPSEGMLPPALERVMTAFMFYFLNIDADPPKPVQARNTHLRGLGASQGTYTGCARVVHTPADYDRIETGDILVTAFTASSYNVLLPLLGAIVTDRGGALCHTAIVAREFAIPAVVGTGKATSHIPDGARIVVDGTQGVVEILAAET